MSARTLFYTAKTKQDAERKAAVLKKSGYRVVIQLDRKNFNVYGEYCERLDRGTMPETNA